MSNRDDIYAEPLTEVSAFRFDKSVADVFQDMIERSVPGYGQVLQLIGLVTEQYAKSESSAFDLGCSLGASTLQIRRHLPSDCHVVGVDTSDAMVVRAQSNLERDHSAATFEIRQEDLRDTALNNASIVVLNYTLQFLPLDERSRILHRIYEALSDGGVLLLSEKIRFEDANQQSLMTDLHHQFKRQQGYSDLEISQKRTALENVLIPDTEQIHIERLKQAGFSDVQVCLQCINFFTFLAIK